MAVERTDSGIFGKLLLWQKFLIVGLIFAVMTAIPSYSFFNTQQDIIDTTRHSQEGMALAKPLIGLVQALPAHRAASTGLLSGNEALAAEEKASREEADRAIAAFDKLARPIRDAGLLKAWGEFKQEWPKVVQAAASRSAAPQENFDAHGKLIATVLNLLERVTDYSGLSLDPVAETYFLIQAILSDGPAMTEFLAQARTTGGSLLAKSSRQAGSVTLQERAKLGSLATLARDRLSAMARNLEKSAASAAIPKTALDQPVAGAIEQIGKAIELSDAEIVTAANPGYSATEFQDRYSQAINEAYKLLGTGTASLDNLLAERLASSRQTLFTISAALLTIFLVGTLIAVYIISSITGPVSHLVGVVNRLAGGDSQVRAKLETFDEVGLLARQFDIMVDQREAVSARIQEENQQLNNSVIDLLQAVARLAQKDLTVRVPVAEDITGPVGDALNLLSEETAKVLNRVTEIAGNVAKVSGQVKAQSDLVIRVASEEKREVEQAAAELAEASETMQDIARLATTCNDAAEKAIRNTDKAQEAVLDTVQGITAIRDTIRETEKRIKRLGERSQEIGGVVNLINSIAERTHILALNASMHAASAGEAGRGFAVVANEVQRLAENAREATSKISGLVNNIQVETADTVATMNDAISQVVQGTTLAQQAGGEMKETRDTTADLVQLVQRIAASSAAQAQTALRLRERATQIQKSTEQTYQQLQDQGQQTERLVDFSGGLVESVGVFILPGKTPGLAAAA